MSWGDSARFANWLHNGQPTGPQGLSTTGDGAYYPNGALSNAALLAVTRNADWKWAITSEDESYKAAYHKNDGVTGNYWDYPTSSNTAPGQDMADASGNNANYYTAPYVFPIDPPYRTTVVGQFENSDSPLGTFDQGGNVWEWNEAVLYGSYRGLRGGSFNANDYHLHASNRGYGDPANDYATAGFRGGSRANFDGATGAGWRRDARQAEGAGKIALCRLSQNGTDVEGITSIRSSSSTYGGKPGRL